MNTEKKAMLAAAAAYGIFGLSYLFSKTALNITEPEILLCARFALTVIILNLLLVCRVFRLDLRGKSLKGPVLLGLLQPVAYFILENYGLKYTSTSFTGIMSATGPIYAALLGAIVLRQRTSLRQWIFIFISIAGVMLVSVSTVRSGVNTPAGCICLAAAYLAGAFYSMLSAKLSDRFTPMEITYIMFTVGFVFFAMLAGVKYGKELPSMFAYALPKRDFIISVVYLGGLSSVVAYFLVNYSLGKLPVARNVVFTGFATIVSVLSGVIIMGDPFGLKTVIAVVLIIAGVTGVNYAGGKKDL